MEIASFAQFIKERCGLVVKDHESLAQAINERMSATAIPNRRTKYFKTILGSLEETHHLINLLTNNETYFLREIEHFELFSNSLIPKLLRAKLGTGKKVKALSVGCSSGEEPYSMVLSLVEKLGRQITDSIQVVGCDIDRNVIQAARSGVYSKNSFRGVGDDFRDKYFDRLAGTKYQIKDYVRESVEFVLWNMVSGVFPPVLPDADIIFYRNVSIYFEPETRKRVFNRLSNLLNENGYLFLSSAETFFHDMGSLFLENIEGTFFYRKYSKKRGREKFPSALPLKDAGTVLRPALDKRPGNDFLRSAAAGAGPKPGLGKKESPETSVSSEGASPPKSDDAHSCFGQALAHAGKKENEEALRRLDALLESSPDFVKARNLKASIFVNQGRVEEARNICLKTLELDEWSPECCLLLGFIAKTGGDEREALAQFKKVVYVDSGCWLAHMYLADIYNALGQLESAFKEYSLTSRLLKKHGAEDESFFLLPLAFPPEQVVHLCVHNMNNLQQRLSA